MNLNIERHVAVVVGGASGIGRACAERFLAEGARVAVWDLNTPTDFDNQDVLSLQCDICQQTDIEKAINQTEAELGPVRHVVHAAAVGSGIFGQPFTRLEPEQWRQVLDVNVHGMVNVAHALTNQMRPRGEGTFVFISSVAGQIGSPTDPPYSASKAAGINFSQCMAKDLARHGIRVNTVCPGMVKTPLNRAVWKSWCERHAENSLSYEEWAEQKIGELVPLGRWQTPEDVADMVVFLSSARAEQVTGQTINVDGGYVMHW